MEEKERIVRDLTGNREEKIAPKKPAQGAPETEKPAFRRPPTVRQANFAGEAKERLSGKKARSAEAEEAPKDGEELPQNTEALPPEESFPEESFSSGSAPEEDFSGEAAPAEESVPRESASVDPEQLFEVVSIRFRGTGKSYYFDPAGETFSVGDHAIVETVRGMEYGEVTAGNHTVPGKEVVPPLKPVERKATPADDAHDRENHILEQNAKPIFYDKVEKNKLEMQLVDVEYTFDNSKLCFYFTADGRVDFRGLVKDLAGMFRTRIELRQIGVRDEARLFGGLGVCGRPFCCNTFLSDFGQVSIKMAKEQSLALSTVKISGYCNRLMCCLRFEQETYERENAEIPRRGTLLETPKGQATVLESSFLTRKVKVRMLDDNTIRTFTLEELQGSEDASAEPQEDVGSEPQEAAASGEERARTQERRDRRDNKENKDKDRGQRGQRGQRAQKGQRGQRPAQRHPEEAGVDPAGAKPAGEKPAAENREPSAGEKPRRPDSRRHGHGPHRNDGENRNRSRNKKPQEE